MKRHHHGGRRFAWISSRWPEPLLTYIAREVTAVRHVLGAAPPFLSLKPAWTRGHPPNGSADAAARYAPLSRAAHGLATLLGSAATRQLLREVLAAYAGRRVDQAKALLTSALAAGLAPVLHREGIRHLHAHFAAMPGLAAYVLHRTTGVSYSIAAHGWDIYVDDAMLREKLAAAEFVVACTGSGRTALVQRGAPASRTLLCYHGLPLPTLPPPVFPRGQSAPHATVRVVAVGRLVEQKGFGHLIEACRLLRRRALRVRCRIVGDGPLRSDLRRRIAQDGMADVVRLDGTLTQDGVFAAYRDADVLCAPSVIAADGDRDGIPNVILEAMSQGLPVVGSRLSGIPEVIDHGRTGWLVDAGDAAGLAEALLAVGRDPAEAARRAHAAYACVVRQFDAERNVRPLVARLTGRVAPQDVIVHPGPHDGNAAVEAG